MVLAPVDMNVLISLISSRIFDISTLCHFVRSGAVSTCALCTRKAEKEVKRGRGGK